MLSFRDLGGTVRCYALDIATGGFGEMSIIKMDDRDNGHDSSRVPIGHQY